MAILSGNPEAGAMLGLRVTPTIDRIDAILSRSGGIDAAVQSNIINALDGAVGAARARPVVAFMREHAAIAGTNQYGPRERHELYVRGAEASPDGSVDQRKLAATAEHIRGAHRDLFLDRSPAQEQMTAMIQRLTAPKNNGQMG